MPISSPPKETSLIVAIVLEMAFGVYRCGSHSFFKADFAQSVTTDTLPLKLILPQPRRTPGIQSTDPPLAH